MENEEKGGEIIATNRGRGRKRRQRGEGGDGEGEDTCMEEEGGKRRRTITFVHSNCKCN